MIEQAAVLGASSAVGKAVIDALIRRNIPTKALIDDLEKFKMLYPDGKLPGRVNVLEGDMNSNQALAIVCEYADTIFPCFNTSYHNWERDMTNWIAKTADVAATLGSKIIYPSNIFNIGKTDARKITEEHPQHAHTKIGKLIIALEQRLSRSIAEGASLTVVRFPSLFGPAEVNSTIGKIFTAPLLGEPAIFSGNLETELEFMYNQDAGEILVKTALEPNASNMVLHAPGHVIKMVDWLKLIFDFNGKELNYQKETKWNAIKRNIISRSAPLEKELEYIYEDPLHLDGTKIESILGPISLTNFEEATKQTVDWFAYWVNLTRESS